MATITLFVTTTSDENDGQQSQGTGLSLRDALQQANEDTVNDYVINLEAGKTYDLTLTGTHENEGMTGDLDLGPDSHVTIQVNGQGTATIDANGNDRVFDVLSGGTLTLQDVVVTGGMAPTTLGPETDGRSGGGIRIANGATATLNHVAVTGNETNYLGGGIFSRGDLTLTGGEIGENTAAFHGAGIYSTGQLTVNGTEIRANVASGVGAGIFTTGDADISHTLMLSNQAIKGAGIYNKGVLALDDILLGFNTASEYGAGLFSKGGILTATNTRFSHNRANDEGGGLYSDHAVIDMTESRFDANQAHRGGAISQLGGQVTLDQSEFLENVSTDGGAIKAQSQYIFSPTELNITNSLLKGNSVINSVNGGSAVSVENHTQLTIVGSTLLDNSISTAAFTTNAHGAVKAVKHSHLTVMDSTIQGNLGGGVSTVNQTTAHIESSHILDNRNPDGTGGGLRLLGDNNSNSGAFDNVIKQTVISGNSANVGGGAKFGGFTFVEDSQFIGNTAKLAGGADVSGYSQWNNVEIREGKATGSLNHGFAGGLLFNQSGRHILENVSVKDNTSIRSGAGIAVGVVTKPADLDVIVRNSLLEGNFSDEQGGALHVEYGTVTLEDTVLRENHAVIGGGLNVGERGTTHLVDSQLQANIASKFGGGANVSEGQLTTFQTVISQNQAQEGGGVQIQSHGQATLRATEISHNLATGGLVDINGTLTQVDGVGGGIMVGPNGDVVVQNATISHNRATGSGAGIKVSGSSGPLLPAGEATIEQTTITRNTADSDKDGIGRGGGIDADRYNDIDFYPPRQPVRVTLNNTIVADNADTPNNAGPNAHTPDLHGPMIEGGYNLIGNGDGIEGGLIHGVNGNQIGTASNSLNPHLGPLANNGGTTRTHLLLDHGPAIDGGGWGLQNPLPGSVFQFDQRGEGFLRVVGDFVDIGAVERQLLTLPSSDAPVTPPMIEGTDGRDRLLGTVAGDIIYGYGDRDRLWGQTGDDQLFGGDGNDKLFGEQGDDLLWGGSGYDRLSGGAGADGFVLSLGEGRDRITDFTLGVDIIIMTSDISLGQLEVEQAGRNTRLSYAGDTLAIINRIQASDLIAAAETAFVSMETA